MNNDIDITSGVLFLIGLLALGLIALVTVELIPRVQKLLKPFKDKYPTEFAFLEAQAVTAINGAEQEFGAGEGAQKIESAIVYVEKQAERYGYSYDPYVVNMVIHAKLKAIKNQAVASAGQK